MPSITSLLSFAALAALTSAITVTKPTKHQLWDSSESNIVEWSSVSSDPSTVDIYLVHMAAHPPLFSLLFANVPTSKKTVTVAGLQLPTGDAYQINLVAHDKPEQIYAQSQQFNVTGEGVAATKTLDGYTGPTHNPATASGSAATVSGQSTLVTSTASRSNATATGTESALATDSSTADATESVAGAATTASGTASRTASATASSTANAAVGNIVTGAPIAALVFGLFALFI